MAKRTGKRELTLQEARRRRQAGKQSVALVAKMRAESERKIRRSVEKAYALQKKAEEQSKSAKQALRTLAGQPTAGQAAQVVRRAANAVAEKAAEKLPPPLADVPKKIAAALPEHPLSPLAVKVWDATFGRALRLARDVLGAPLAVMRFLTERHA